MSQNPHTLAIGREGISPAPSVSGWRRWAVEAVTMVLALLGASAAARLWSFGTGGLVDGQVLAPGPWQATRLGWWLGVPVFCYFTTLFALAAAAVVARRWAPRPSWRRSAEVTILATAVGLGGAGVWCLAAALAGQMNLARLTFQVIVLSVLLTWTVWSFQAWLAPSIRRGRAMLLGLGLAALLPIGQAVSPSAAMAQARDFGKYEIGSGTERVIQPYDSRTRLPVAGMPLLGSPTATYVVLSFFDYTNDESRTTQRAMLALRQRFGDQVAVLLALYPLDPGCNPKVTPDLAPENPDAHAYAKLALAVWLARPQALETMHAFLSAAEKRQDMPTPDQARARAAELVGEPALQRAMADPRMDQLLALSIEAKPRRLSIGRRNDTGQIVDLRPCTMWKPLASQQPGMVAVGELTAETFLRQFEKDTGALPSAQTDARAPGLMELLE